VQRQHRHAEHVLPVEGGGEQPAVEDHLLPDAAGDHDQVEQGGLQQHAGGGERLALTGAQEAQHQAQADQEDEELQWREQALHQGPAGGVTAAALGGGVERPAG